MPEVQEEPEVEELQCAECDAYFPPEYLNEAGLCDACQEQLDLEEFEEDAEEA